MAREVEQRRSRIRFANSPATKHALKTKDTTKSKDLSKPKKAAVSASGLFRKKPAKDEGKVVSRRHQPREQTLELPEHAALAIDLQSDITNGIEVAADSINTTIDNAYNDIYRTFSKRLVNANLDGSLFKERVLQATAELSEPLAEEKINTIFIRPDGTRSTQVVKIGSRIALLREVIEQEGGKLDEYWKEWEETQRAIEELGINVFGGKAFGEEDLQEFEDGKRSFKREMELINLEDKTKTDEFLEESEQISAKALEKSKSSEKELNDLAHQEQTRMFMTILGDA